jgi:hypothetical protein
MYSNILQEIHVHRSRGHRRQVRHYQSHDATIPALGHRAQIKLLFKVALKSCLVVLRQVSRIDGCASGGFTAYVLANPEPEARGADQGLVRGGPGGHILGSIASE